MSKINHNLLEVSVKEIAGKLVEYGRRLRRDRQVIFTRELDDETLDAILTAEPGERSKEAGRRHGEPDSA